MRNGGIENLCNDGFLNLAHSIVAQAVKDYKTVLRCHKTNDKNANTDNLIMLRLFFKSDWCDMLVEDLGYTGEGIMQNVEREMGVKFWNR